MNHGLSDSKGKWQLWITGKICAREGRKQKKQGNKDYLGGFH